MAAKLASLPCSMMVPGALHRVIAACQQIILRSGAVALGSNPKHGNPEPIAARARTQQAREA